MRLLVASYYTQRIRWTYSTTPAHRGSAPSHATHAHERDPHLLINRLPNTPPTPPQKCSCVHKESTTIAHYTRQVLSNRTLPRAPHSREHLTPHPYTHRLHKQNTKHFPANTILGTTPPSTNTQRELHLPREDRVYMPRFRCGHYTSISAYMYRIARTSNANALTATAVR